MLLSGWIQLTRYKRAKKGTELEGYEGLPLLDVDGNPIKATEEWKAPINLKQFNSAVTGLHSAFQHDGPSACQNCLASIS